VAEEKIPQPTFLSGLGNFYFNIKYDDCYPFIFTNIKGLKEEDMDTYIRNHKDDFIGQAEESLPIKSCRRLFELFGIDTDRLEL
jgi:hypothetical protein